MAGEVQKEDNALLSCPVTEELHRKTDLTTMAWGRFDSSEPLFPNKQKGLIRHGV
jgi:hypothetical protein